MHETSTIGLCSASGGNVELIFVYSRNLNIPMVDKVRIHYYQRKLKVLPVVEIWTVKPYSSSSALMHLTRGGNPGASGSIPFSLHLLKFQFCFKRKKNDSTSRIIELARWCRGNFQIYILIPASVSSIILTRSFQFPLMFFITTSSLHLNQHFWKQLISSRLWSIQHRTYMTFLFLCVKFGIKISGLSFSSQGVIKVLPKSFM